MGDYEVSLVIPVYNVEKYLRKCLDSAVEQTLKDIEIIIVNDGSTDNGPKIIEEYAAKDQRIKVIDQKNRGLSAARNAGIQMAKGEYLAFMDSDDWMDNSFLEKMLKEAREKKADIVVCNHIKVVEGVGDFPGMMHMKSGVLTGDEAMRKVISDSGIHNYAWDKLYKRSLFALNNITYPQGLYFEDMATTFKLFYYSRSVAVLNECLYYYLQRKNSISKKDNPKRVYDTIQAMTLMREFLEKHHCMQKYAHEYQYLCYKMIFCSIFNLTVIYRSTGKPGLYKSIQRSVKKIILLSSVNSTSKVEQENKIA